MVRKKCRINDPGQNNNQSTRARWDDIIIQSSGNLQVSRKKILIIEISKRI